MPRFTFRIPGTGDVIQDGPDLRVPVKGDVLRWMDVMYEVSRVIYRGDAELWPLVELVALLHEPCPPRDLSERGYGGDGGDHA